MKDGRLHLLFETESREERSRFRHLRPASVAFGFVNLLLLARADAAARADSASPALPALLFLELSALALLHVFYHTGVTARVLASTETLPVPPSLRMRFSLLGPLRRPFTIACAAPLAFFLAVTVGHGPWTPPIAALAVLTAAAGVSVWTGALLSLPRRTGPDAVAALLLLGVPVTVFTGLLLDLDTVLSTVPPVGLAAEAVASAAGGRYGTSALALGLLAALTLLPFAPGRHR